MAPGRRDSPSSCVGSCGSPHSKRKLEVGRMDPRGDDPTLSPDWFSCTEGDELALLQPPGCAEEPGGPRGTDLQLPAALSSAQGL